MHLLHTSFSSKITGSVDNEISPFVPGESSPSSAKHQCTSINLPVWPPFKNGIISKVYTFLVESWRILTAFNNGQRYFKALEMTQLPWAIGLVHCESEMARRKRTCWVLTTWDPAISVMSLSARSFPFDRRPTVQILKATKNGVIWKVPSAVSTWGKRDFKAFVYCT